MVNGVVDAVKHPIDTSVALYHLVGNSPEDRAFQMQAADTLTTQVKDAYNRDVTNGDIQSQFKFFSRGVFEVVSAVGGPKGVTQALDATKAAKVAEVVEVTGTVKKAEEVVKTTQGLGEAADSLTTYKVYRKMSEEEYLKTINSGELQPAITGTNSSKYLTQSLNKAKEFDNNAVKEGTKEIVVEFEVTPEYYKKLVNDSIDQTGSKGIDAVKFNKEGLDGTDLKNLGIPKTQLDEFNKNVVNVRKAQ